MTIESMAPRSLALTERRAFSNKVDCSQISLRDRRFAVLRRAHEIALELRNDRVPCESKLFNVEHPCERDKVRASDADLTEKKPGPRRERGLGVTPRAPIRCNTPPTSQASKRVFFRSRKPVRPSRCPIRSAPLTSAAAALARSDSSSSPAKARERPSPAATRADRDSSLRTTVKTEIVTGQSVSRQAKRRRVETTFAPSAIRPMEA